MKLAFKLFKYIRINYYDIELVDVQQLLYKLIYSLKSVELEILKTYIKINLVNSFIRPFKLLGGTFIFFDKNTN